MEIYCNNFFTHNKFPWLKCDFQVFHDCWNPGCREHEVTQWSAFAAASSLMPFWIVWTFKLGTDYISTPTPALSSGITAGATGAKTTGSLSVLLRAEQLPTIHCILFSTVTEVQFRIIQNLHWYWFGNWGQPLITTRLVAQWLVHFLCAASGAFEL